MQDVESASAQLNEFLSDVIRAFEAHGEAFRSERHRWGLQEDLMDFGLVQTLVAAESPLLANHDEVQQKILAISENETEDLRMDLCAVQVRRLLSQVPDYTVAANTFMDCDKFCVQYSTGPEAKLRALKMFMSLLPDESLRKAVGITAHAKYESLKINPASWRDDISRLLTYAFLVFTAHHCQ